MIKLPPPLSAGDLVGVAAPAGYLTEHERYHKGCELLRQMGFQIYESEKRWPGYGYLADTDQARIEEFHRLWETPQVKAIFALRGGFGCLRLLEYLDPYSVLPVKNTVMSVVRTVHPVHPRAEQ